MEVPFYKHDIQPEDKERLLSILDGPFLTTGNVTTTFEDKLGEAYGVKHAIGTTNWTSAAELLLRLWEVGPGDEVIVPTMSYVASAHVVALRGAKPVFIDSDRETGLLDLNELEAKINSHTKVIMPVHLYGVMADMTVLRELADKHGIRLFEDAAHAVIGSRDGVFPGQVGDAAALSFYATKNITSGEGGALLTNNDELALRFRQGTSCGVTKTAYDRRREGGAKYVGYDSTFPSGKCNMTNIQAALLEGQLSRLKENRRHRAELVAHYRRELATIPGIQLPVIPEGVESAHYTMVMLVIKGLRDKVFESFGREKIGCAINFEPIHLRTFYKEQQGYREGDFPVAEDWGNRCVTLPLYPSLQPEQIDHIISVLREEYLPLVG